MNASGRAGERLGVLLALAMLGPVACVRGERIPQGAGADVETDVTALFPLVSGAAWSYVIDTGTGITTLAIMRVEEVAEDGWVRVRTANGTARRYLPTPEGIRAEGEGEWLLRAPIRVGARWRAPGGRSAEVLFVDAEVSTPAGRFTGCVEVEARSPSGAVSTTSYRSGVGPVRIVSSSPPSRDAGRGGAIRALLRGYTLRPIDPH